MKLKQKKSSKSTLSEKIADALTVKPRADIEDDQVFGTKPKTLSRADFSSSDSEDEAVISDFRKRSVNLLSEVSEKYKGKVVSRKDFENDSDGSSKSNISDTEQTTKDKQGIKPGDDSISDSESLECNNAYELQKKISIGSKQKQTDSEGDTYDSEESDDYSITTHQKLQNEDSQSDNDASDYSEDEGYDISQMEEPEKEEFEHVKKKNISEEVKKGKCVRNQLLIWEGLLEMRIHLQRCMNTANRMPLPDIFGDFKKNKTFEEELNVTRTNVTNVLEKFLSLQSMLLNNFPETKSLSLKNLSTESKLETGKDSEKEIPSDMDEEIPSDTDAEDEAIKKDEEEVTSTKSPKATAKKRKLNDFEKELATSHKSFKTFRNTTIQKWNDKTRLATATNIKNTPANTILQQISYILSDREKLLRRTQLKRSDYEIIGYKKPIIEENTDQNNQIIRGRKDDDEYIPEIFDDSDFYHQLLRELIECKSTDISDPVQLSRQWIALQQMRSKMKRKVDTKATKGRKIKYVVHNQLVNYMAPEKCTTWNDESRNELYSSLFGKMFESNNAGFNGNVGNVF